MDEEERFDSAACNGRLARRGWRCSG